MQTIEKIKNNENMLIKFLAAWKWNVQNAMAFMQERLDFMEKYNLDWEIKPDVEFPNIIEDNPVVIHKFDLYGRPICYTIVKNIHPERYTDEQLWNFTTWYTYWLENLFPKNIDNYIVIYDFKGAGLKNINYH